LTGAPWVGSFNTPNNGQGKTDRSCQNMTLSLHDLLSTGLQFLGVEFITSLKSNLCTALTTQNTKITCIDKVLFVPTYALVFKYTKIT